RGKIRRLDSDSCTYCTVRRAKVELKSAHSLVLITGLEILRVLLFNLGIGQAITHARVQFIQSLPTLRRLEGEVCSSLDGAPQGRRPKNRLPSLGGLGNESREGPSISLATGRQLSITTNLSGNIKHRLAMLEELAERSK